MFSIIFDIALLFIAIPDSNTSEFIAAFTVTHIFFNGMNYGRFSISTYWKDVEQGDAILYLLDCCLIFLSGK